jgi:hypothetical protein
MSDKEKETLKESLRDAEISDVEMEDVSGGSISPLLGMSCSESCEGGCSQCCSPGNAQR